MKPTILKRAAVLMRPVSFFWMVLLLGTSVWSCYAQDDHNHGNLEMDIIRANGYVRILYYAQANKRTVLQYLPVASPTNVGTNLLNAAWVNFPSGQAPVNPTFRLNWEIRDYSITNRATNLSRIYRLRIT